MANAIDLEIAAELNPEAAETRVDLEARRRKMEKEYIRARMTRVNLEARLRILEEEYIRAKTKVDLEIEIAELNPEAALETLDDLEAHGMKLKEDYIRAKMRYDLEVARRKIEEDYLLEKMNEAQQRKIEEEYNRVKPRLLVLIEKPFLVYSNYLKWVFEVKLDLIEEKPRRRKVWAALGGCSWCVTLVFGKDFIRLSGNLWLHLLYFLSIYMGYPVLLLYLYNIRHPLHYVLRRSHKQLFESALVLLSSSWVYYTTDDILRLSMTGPFLCLDAIPCLNLWWSFDNFGFLDCSLVILIQAALLCCRHRGLVALMVVTVVGLALQFIKNAYSQYRSHKIKNQTMEHLV